MKMRWTWRGFLGRVHRDEGGNLGVLLLLVIWGLVLLIAMVWNTSEATSRRAHVQNAADASAHAAATWMTRTTNLSSGTNVLLGENASAEIMLRSVQPTIDSIADRLQREEAAWKRRLIGNKPGVGEKPLQDIEWYEEVLGTEAWSGNAQGTQLLADLAKINTDVANVMPSLNPYLTAGQKTTVQNNTIGRIARNKLALEYVQGVWIDGGAPANANFPTAPTWGGQTGLRGILGPWFADIKLRYKIMLDALPSQWAVWQQFVDQTAPAMNFDLALLSARRAAIHEYQQTILGLTPQAGEEQRTKLATFFKADVTLADPATLAGSSDDAQVKPPVEVAANVEAFPHVDSIRPMYPDAAQKRFGTADPTMAIDPINVNMDFAALWHPGTPVTTALISGGPTHTYHVKAGEWAEIQCAPLARYINHRVSRDEEGLAEILRQLDDIRAAVRTQIYPVPWVPEPVKRLPAKLVLDATIPPKELPLPPEAIAALPKPGAAPAATLAQVDEINKAIATFNKNVTEYISSVRGLYTNDPASGISPLEHLAMRVSGEIDGGTHRFAEQTWRSHVERWRYEVLKQMGYDKAFMVLKSYELRKIPEWAKGGVHDTAYKYVYGEVYARNIGATGSGWSIYQWNTNTWWTGLYGAVHKDLYNDLIASGMSPGAAWAQANAKAPDLAKAICATGSAVIAGEVAAEWIERPWPYEITPPEDAGDPKSEGWRTKDRPKYFTLLAGATNTEANAPKYTLPKMMGEAPKNITAFAQGEAFNWMEHHGSYGAGDTYDAISSYGHGVVSGSPGPWRVASRGGWTWQPRLALSDQIGEALEKNPKLQAMFSGAGVPVVDKAAVKTVTMH